MSMPYENWKIRRLGQISIDTREAGDLVQEIGLIHQSWFRGEFDEQAFRGLLVARGIELMPCVFNGAPTPAFPREPPNGLKLVEGCVCELDRVVEHTCGPFFITGRYNRTRPSHDTEQDPASTHAGRGAQNPRGRS